MTPGNGDACVPQRPVKALPTPEAPRHATALLCFPNHGKAVLFSITNSITLRRKLGYKNSTEMHFYNVIEHKVISSVSN